MIKIQMTIASIATLGLASSAALAAPPTITDLAPEGTVFVAGVENCRETMNKLDDTRLWELWQSNEMKAMRTHMIADLDDELEEMAERLGVDTDEIGLPSGHVGIAVFAVMDNEIGMPVPGYLFTADFGAKAEGAMKVMMHGIDEGVQKDELTTKEHDVRGRTVHQIEYTPPVVEDEPEDEWDAMGGMGGMGGLPMGDPEMIAGAFNNVYLVREGTQFMWSNDFAILRDAIDVCADDAPNGLGQRDDYLAVMSRVGENDAYMAVLMRDASGLMSVADPMGLVQNMIGPMIKQVIGDIAGIGGGVVVRGEQAMVEQTLAVYMPNGRSGITALMDTAEPRRDVPGFVGPDTVSYSTMNFEFEGLPQALAPIFQMMQMMMPPGAAGPNGAQAPPMNEMMEQVCSWLGRRVHMVQTIEKPLRVDSMKQLVAVECTNARAFEQFLEFQAPAMGMESREFNGQRIYTMDEGFMDMMPAMPVAGGGMQMPPMEPPAIGIGGGYFFAGQRSSVEQALRTIGDDQQANLGDAAAFNRAVGAIDDQALVGWGYSDFVETTVAALKMGQMNMDQMRAAVANADGGDFGGMDVDWDEQDEKMAELLREFDVDMLRRYLGPASWDMRATDDGFVMRSFMLDSGPLE